MDNSGIKAPSDFKFKKILPVALLFLLLPVLIWAQQIVTSYLSRAAYKKADIVVETNIPDGRLTGNWLNFAQGGEEPPPMLETAVEKMLQIHPKYIRLDHIYDYYDVVKSDGSYDFTKLDRTVNDILKMGALPFFSLSYMPKEFNDSQSVIEYPRDWSLWQNLVRATIEQYSGRDKKNINSVYYEVWNEPELGQFGAWKTGGSKNYNILYQFASNGAKEAVNTNNFYLGGPAVGSYYPAWINNFVRYAHNNNLRLDFYSWHRYHSSSTIFRDDAIKTRELLKKFTRFANIPLVLSEWGMDSSNNLNSNSQKAASHALATVFNIYEVIDLPFNFEVKDGPPPMGGKWGLLTHEKDTIPLMTKPRFKAFAALSKIRGTKLKASGLGSNVKALAVKSDEGIIRVLLTNYDPYEKNLENVPVTFSGLTPGFYQISNKNINADSAEVKEISTTDGLIKEESVMLPNSSILLEIQKRGLMANLIQGTSGLAEDKALVLSNNNDLILSPVDFSLSGEINFRFDMKPFWTDNREQIIKLLKLDFINENGEKITAHLEKVKSKNVQFLLLTIGQEIIEDRVSLAINDWESNNWHNIAIGISEGKLILTADGANNGVDSSILPKVQRLTGISFFPFNGAIDNLTITSQDNILFQRNFDQ